MSPASNDSLLLLVLLLLFPASFPKRSSPTPPPLPPLHKKCVQTMRSLDTLICLPVPASCSLCRRQAVSECQQRERQRDRGRDRERGLELHVGTSSSQTMRESKLEIILSRGHGSNLSDEAFCRKREKGEETNNKTGNGERHISMCE